MTEESTDTSGMATNDSAMTEEAADTSGLNTNDSSMTEEPTDTSVARTMESLIDEALKIIRNVSDKAGHVFVNKNQCECLARRFTKLGEALEAMKNDDISWLEKIAIMERIRLVLIKGEALVESYEDEEKALANALSRAENKKSFQEIHKQLDNLKSEFYWLDDENTEDDAAENDRDAIIQDLGKLDLTEKPQVNMSNVKKVVHDRIHQDALHDDDLSYLHIDFDAITFGDAIKKLPKELNKRDKHLEGKALVYKGSWNGCDYAIKVFMSDDLRWNMEELQKEFASLVKLRHPHITQLIGCAQKKVKVKDKTPIGCAQDEVKPKTCVLYEKMDGDLRDLINKLGKKPRCFSATQEVSIITQIAQGMCYLHEHGIVHGELKCTNVLVKKVGDNIDVKVSDFHCSRELGNNEKYNPTHRTRWLPPEAFDHFNLERPPAHDLLKKGDVYSFAMTCCEIVTGGYPFDGIKDDEDLRKRILGDDDHSRPKLPDHLSDDLKGLIKRCWSKNPMERPTFEQICDILERDAKAMATRRRSFFSLGKAADKSVRDAEESQVSKKRREGELKKWPIEFQKDGDEPESEHVKGLPLYLKRKPWELKPISILGSGSSAEVWACTYIGCKLAVKYMEVSHVSSLRKEVGIMMKLLHPNVIRLYGFVAKGNRCGIVMELMDMSLHAFIKKKMENSTEAPFSEAEAIAIITKLALGMDFMHSREDKLADGKDSRGVAHGDLKCANVLVRIEQKNRSYYISDVKLVDFGLAHVEGQVEKNPTRVGACQAPQVNECKSTNDWKAADVYSFGMMCWEIITGKFVKKNEPHPRKREPSKIRKELWILLNDCWKDTKRPAFPEICERLAGMSPKARWFKL